MFNPIVRTVQSGASTRRRSTSSGSSDTSPMSLVQSVTIRSALAGSKLVSPNSEWRAMPRMRRTGSASAFARSVGTTPDLPLRNNWSENSTRSLRSEWLTALWVTSRSCAARVTLPWRSNASSVMSRLRSRS
jgi:hypothetical protein